VLRTILLLTKGIIRDQRLRRSLMFWIMLVALVMLFIGSWILSDHWARQHPWLYLIYWLICAWLTLTCVLLALLDILALRAAQRAARRVLEKQMLDEVKDDPNQ
jgi:TRAP-type C4-dicarboxylate transport system permease small subunit